MITYMMWTDWVIWVMLQHCDLQGVGNIILHGGILCHHDFTACGQIVLYEGCSVAALCRMLSLHLMMGLLHYCALRDFSRDVLEVGHSKQ